MRITIVSCVYPPEPVVSARTSEDLAKYLHARGNEVSVIAPFPNRPSGQLYPGFVRRWLQQESSCTGFSLIRCFSFFSRRPTLLSRLAENISFGLSSSIALMVQKRPEIVYANTWPLFAMSCCAMVCRLRNIRLVLSVQDIYPESLSSQNHLRENSLTSRFLRRWDAWILRSADSVVAISGRLAGVIRSRRKVDPRKVHIVPNWADKSAVDRSISSQEARRSLGLPSRGRLFVYAGNIGLASGIEALIPLFGEVSKHSSSSLLIAGEGSLLEKCRRLSDRTESNRIRIHSPWPVSETSLVLRAADILVLPTRGRQSAASLPSKVIAYMLASRPVLAVTAPHTDLADLIEQSGCGWTVDTQDPEALTSLLKHLSEIPQEELDRRGEAGRMFAERHFDKELCISGLVRILVQNK